MPIYGEEEFRKLCKETLPAGLYCLFGEDLYLKDFYRNKIVSQTVAPAFAAFNLHTFTRDESPLETILDAMDALPVMSERQCVLVKDYPLASLDEDDTKMLEDALKNLADTTVLLFFFSSPEVAFTPKRPDKWTKVLQLLAKYGTVVNLAHRSPAAVAKTLMSGAKERGAKLDAETASYIVERAGNDLQTLLNEFNKLCAYADGAPITKEMIDECIVKSVEASVFDISHALLTGNADRAFEILRELLRQKTEAPNIIGALAYTWTDFYRVKVMLRGEDSINALVEPYNYKGKEYALSRAASEVKNYTLRQLKEAVDILADADRRSKSSAVSAQLLLEETFARLAAVYEESV